MLDARHLQRLQSNHGCLTGGDTPQPSAREFEQRLIRRNRAGPSKRRDHWPQLDNKHPLRRGGAVHRVLVELGTSAARTLCGPSAPRPRARQDRSLDLLSAAWSQGGKLLAYTTTNMATVRDDPKRIFVLDTRQPGASRNSRHYGHLRFDRVVSRWQVLVTLIGIGPRQRYGHAAADNRWSF
jgi:hypothetical protein